MSERVVVEAEDQERPADLGLVEARLGGSRASRRCRRRGRMRPSAARPAWRRADAASASSTRSGLTSVDMNLDATIEEGKRHEQALRTDADHQGRRRQKRCSEAAQRGQDDRHRLDADEVRRRERRGSAMRSGSAPRAARRARRDDSCRPTVRATQADVQASRHWAHARQATLGSTTTVCARCAPSGTPSPDGFDGAERLVPHHPRIGRRRPARR